MSEQVPEAEENAVTQEEVSLAEAQEQAELNAVQNGHLKRRVVVLRIQNNRLQDENQQLKAEVERLQDQLPKDTDQGPQEGLSVVADE